MSGCHCLVARNNAPAYPRSAEVRHSSHVALVANTPQTDVVTLVQQSARCYDRKFHDRESNMAQ